MEEKSILDQPGHSFNVQQPLPNATAVLVLGILSLVVCFAGLILSIISLVLANKDIRLYQSNAEAYTAASYSNLKAGRTCSIIGLILNALLVLVYAAVIVFALYTNRGRALFAS